MDKIKRYIDCGIATTTCNLHCHYCYIAQRKLFNNEIVQFRYSKEYIRKAFSKERWGGVCLLNLCAAGETLLSEEILPIVKELLLEGHYIMIVTNGTLSKRFEEILTWDKNLLSHLFFKFSFHFLELKRLQWIERFFDNVNLMKNAGASFTVEITPSDELVPYINEIKEICWKHLGALCHVTIARNELTEGFEILTNHSREEYRREWGVFDSLLFEFKNEIWGKKRTEFCYAGDWSFFVGLDSGELRQCVYEKRIDNIYEDINRPIHFEAVGHNCSMSHCYNGHAYLALGVIPELDTPAYAALRNRNCQDGTEWLAPVMKEFMSSKLKESNREYDNWRKMKLTFKRKLQKKKNDIRCKLSGNKVIRKIRNVASRGR